MKKKDKKQKKSKSSADKPVATHRLAWFGLCLSIAGIALIGRIGWLQFVDGSKLKELASRQQTINEVISPKRGSIYDTNGKALAISASVDTISINPQKIDEKNKEKVAQALSDIFELDFETVLSQVSSSSSVVTIAKKVESDKVTSLKNWMSDNKISSGINIDEDTKRYYPYSTLASHVVGFTGTDSQGLYGIESKWNSTLAGVAGKIVTTADVNNSEISSDASQYVEVENGSDLYLTIDINIQSIVEKYLEQGVKNANASAGSALAMNPKTGDILAMATYPYYDLNSPFTIIGKDTSEMTTTEKNNALYEIWADKNFSATYEPGSTFKTLVTAIALEEGITKTQIAKDFNCTGSIEVADRTIRCASHEVHGYQTLKEALANSCNVGFIQLGQRIGVKTLYKYFSAFGLFDKTGVQITGEYNSVFHNQEEVGPVELATISFGQRFEITPLQLVTAVSSIANGGTLMQPRLVKQVVNTDTNSATNIDTKAVRTVISEETAKQVCDLMEYVVTDGSGKKAAIPGYYIGGKTGTAEGTYNTGSSYAVSSVSFISIAPVEDSEITLLVVLYDPQTSSTYGSTLVAPIVSSMLKEILPYMGIGSSDSGSSPTSSANTLITVPDITNKTLTEAIKTLQNSGLNVCYANTPNANSVLVTEQVPAPGTALYTNSIIALYTKENSVRTSVTVPDLQGYTLAQARSVLSSLKLNLKFVGTGTVSEQDIAADSSVEEGTVITVTLK